MINFKVFEEIAELKRGYDLPDYLRHEGLVPVVSSSGISGYHNIAKVKAPGVVTGRYGTMGKPYYLDVDFWPHNTSLYVKDFKGNLPLYIFYLLKIFGVSNISEKSTVPGIDRRDLHLIKVPYINTLEQKKVVKIIYAIDNKININNRTNSELEKMAKMLYDYWFVQFDFPNENGKPYRTSGGAMVYNKTLKREIPVGWKVKRLSEILSINRKCFNGEKANLYGIDLSVMPSKTMCINDRSKAENFDTNQFVMKKYDILFGSIRPYLYKAGFAPFDGVVNGTVHSFSSKKINDYSFALMTIVSDMMFSYAITRSGGTKMPIIKADDLLEYCVAVDEETAIKYHEKVRSYWELIAKNIQQNFELSDLRDFLLPLLMTGQVKVK